MAEPPPAPRPLPRVDLLAVDEEVLAALVRAATTGAAADEVTPPDGEGPDWSEARVAWMTALHRDRRGGLDGPAGEATWAVRVAGQVVGAIRLRRTEEPGTYETGIWLTRAARGSRVGVRAVSAVIERAAAAGAARLRADTAAGNLAALAVLRRLGFTLAEPDAGGRVAARLDLRGARPPGAG